MSSSLLTPNPKSFITNDFNLDAWESIAPFYQDLEERVINSLEDFEQWFKDWDELYAVSSESMRWKYIKTSVDTTDQEAQKKMQDFYVNIDPKMKLEENKLQHKFNNSPFKEQLSPDFINIKREIALDLALFNEENIALSKEISLLENEYAKFSGAWSINYKGEDLTMPQAAKFMKSIDRAERETVFTLNKEREYQDADALDTLLSDLIQKRHQLALNAGYKNYRDYAFDAMHRFDYTPADCEAFHKSVANAIIPLWKVLDEGRKAALDVEVLKLWDLAVDPLQKEPMEPFANTDEFVNKTVDCFNKLDPYFGACIANMHEMGRLDLESRKGKAPGGYMMGMPDSGVPYIFMNHASSEGDVRVMVHEGGHAIHGYLSYSVPHAIMRNPSSEVAELASMAMELFSLENWESFYADKEELSRAKRNHLESLLKLLPSVAKGDAFQHWMYTNPTHTVAERRAKWLELNALYSTGVVDNKDQEKYVAVSYQEILHFYQVPFYFIEYGFAQLGAIAMWKNYKENKEKTIEDYKAALSLGFSRSIPEIYKKANIRFDFSTAYVQDLASFVQKQLKAL